MTAEAARSRFLTTLAYTRRPAWTERADIAEPGVSPVRLAVMAGHHEAVVLNGSVRRDQVAAALVARRRQRPVVVLADATWKAGSSASSSRLRRVAARALDHPNAHYCVLSRDEARQFPANWGVAPERVHVTHFHWVLDERLVERVPEPVDGVFAGGDSLREYGPLLEAADGLPARVTIASRTARPARTPANVTLGALDADDYDEHFRRAAIVVVPLKARSERSAGQQTYLNAMVLGKAVIVTDALGVREYVEHGRTGLVVPPADPAALRAALDWALDPANQSEVRALGRRAREAALERFGPERYAERLLQVLDLALERHTPARP